MVTRAGPRFSRYGDVRRTTTVPIQQTSRVTGSNFSAMKVLIVGSGAREHALAWKLAEEAMDVLVAPGNAGIAREFRCVAGDAFEIAQREHPDIVVVGPEDPLIAGLADRLRAEGILVFGPGADGARLEGSKAYSKALMTKAGVPTADYRTFTDLVEAAAWMHERGGAWAVKASGAALGKGVVMVNEPSEIDPSIDAMRALGDAAREVVVEERLDGPEFSLLTLCSEGGIHSLPPAQDYKRIFDGDQGPNTGGMGSYSPVPWVTPEIVRETEERCVRPILALMGSRGIAYRGVLFTGLMMHRGEARVLEYNVRFGDPETQSVVMRLGPGLLASLLACAQGEAPTPIAVRPEAAVSVVLASRGYPGTPENGQLVRVGALEGETRAFYAGVASAPNGGLVNKGGRVLTLSATGPSLPEARELAYRGVAAVQFPTGHARRDIAQL